MAGLLDFEDPNTAGAIQLGLGLLNAGGPSRMPVSMGQGIAQGGEMAMGAMRQARQDLLKKKLAQLEIEKGQLSMDQVKRELAKDEEIRAAFKSSYQSPEQQALAAGGQGPTNAAAATIPNFAPKLDQKGLMSKLMNADPVTALKFKEYLEPKPITVAADSRVLMPDDTSPTGFKTVLGAEKKKTKLDENLDAAGITDPMQRAAFAKKALEKDTSHAPAALNKVEVKMGESVVNQIGPMLKDSKTAALGATKMNDAADRIIKAIDTNAVSSGPLTSMAMTVKQFLNPSGGKETENIRQTRQVIRALAESSVEARKELQGQGQVTENEALAVQKAMSGDIDSLTIGELRDIANLNKKAAAFRARSHKQMLDTLKKDPATSKYAAFYEVEGLDSLASGGKSNVMFEADKIIGAK